ncbi:flavin reductase family protein [Gordonia sp. SL306]|uniref:flavin reductase family protein n=1 Tax=Gordonia sp. SL306 TaxID=2995145 RepID=UPI00226EE7CD|nr:flavin reductase family protein [Gordonia sp. SL306]WAC54320.1 flavin reductase family protein [Gordonia sp. SL306]
MTLDSAFPTTAAELSPAADIDVLKRAYSCFPSGVVAVACRVAGADGAPELVGMAASAFTTVSLDPPLVSLCVQNSSTTWPRLRAAPAIGVSVFARDQSDLCRQLAGPSHARFSGITPSGTDDGAVFIPDAAACLSCSLHNEIPAGDHTLVLLRIEALQYDAGVEPLVFHASTFRSLEVRRTDP